MTVERLLSCLGSPKKTMVYIMAFCGETNQYTTLWKGYTYYPNKQLDTYKDYLVDTYTFGKSELDYSEMYIHIMGYYGV